MKILVFLVVCLTFASAQSNFTNEDWKTFREANDVARFTWAGFIKQFYRRAHDPIRVDPKCFGDWIDADIKKISEVVL